MNQFNEPGRSLDVIAETEVLVVGSGPGGLAAALASARAGAHTILLERNGCFGGNITQVGVEGFAWYRHPGTVDSEGIGIEFEQRAKAMGAAMPEPQSISYALDAEMFKYVADVLVQEAGIQPMLHRLFVAPIISDGAIQGVITESKSGREAILAKRVIDATGDADVAARAGAPTHKTPREQMMAASVMFSMTGVNKQRFIEQVKADPQTYKDWTGNGEWDIETSGKEDDLFSPFLRKPFKQAVDAGIIPAALSTIAGTWGAISDQGDLTYLNLVHLPQIDGTDARDLTAGEIEGRRQAIMAVEALRHFMPGCENAKLRNFGMTLGVRDTRKIDALYNLTDADVRQQGRFEDSIGIFPEFVDGYGILLLPTTGRYFHVPYRSLVPKGVSGLHRRRPLHRRRQDLARGDPQHDVLRGQRPGRRRRRGGLAADRTRLSSASMCAACNRNSSARARASTELRHVHPLRRTRLPKRLRQRVRERGASGGAAARTKLPATLPVRAVRGTAVGYRVYRPAAANRRTWLYRIRPSVLHGAVPAAAQRRVRRSAARRRPWRPISCAGIRCRCPPRRPISSMGSCRSRETARRRRTRGCGIYLYAANQPMRNRCFYSADGELLIVPQLGAVTLDTELGRIEPRTAGDRRHSARRALSGGTAGGRRSAAMSARISARLSSCPISGRSARTASPTRGIFGCRRRATRISTGGTS